MIKSKRVGNNMKTLRKAQGYTQQELADKLGITAQAISSWEIGRTEPNINDIERLAAIFGCEKSVLLNGYLEAYGIEKATEDDSMRRLLAYVCKMSPADEKEKERYIKGLMAAVAALSEANK